MIYSRRSHLQVLLGSITGAALPARGVPVDFGSYTDKDKEEFLKLAKFVSMEQIGQGVTKPLKVGLEFNGVQHSAQIQTVDKPLPDFFPKTGPPIVMRDCWRFNVAAYRVDRLLNLKMVPVTVQRTFKDRPAALTWWVDDVLFEEVDRIKRDVAPPDQENFERQRALGKVFDELIMNIDRNLANLVITNSWNVVLIDHSRSFTAYHGIRNEANLTRCSVALMDKLKTLTAAQVKAAASPFLTDVEVRAFIGRRDRIVAFFEQAAKSKGIENVFFS